MSRLGGMLALVAALAAGGCAQGGLLGGILNPAPNDQMAGTISGVDTRAQQIFLTTDNGQQLALQYDNRTQVNYQGQSYPVGNLARGDVVTARVQGTMNGGYYTDLIQLTQTAQNSGGGNYQTIEGQVSQISYQDGTFVLTSRNAPSVIVAMPYNPRQTDVQRFNQLRNGDYVRLQGQYVANNRFQVAAFM